MVSFIEYDFMLIQSKYWQYQVAMDILKKFPMKVIVLEHTLPRHKLLSQNI